MSNAAAFEGSAAWNFNSQKQNEIGTPNTPLIESRINICGWTPNCELFGHRRYDTF